MGVRKGLGSGKDLDSAVPEGFDRETCCGSWPDSY